MQQRYTCPRRSCSLVSRLDKGISADNFILSISSIFSQSRELGFIHIRCNVVKSAPSQPWNDIETSSRFLQGQVILKVEPLGREIAFVDAFPWHFVAQNRSTPGFKRGNIRRQDALHMQVHKCVSLLLLHVIGHCP